MQLLGLGMGLAGNDLANHDAARIAALKENFIFHLGGGERELLEQLQFVESGEVYEIADPIH